MFSDKPYRNVHATADIEKSDVKRRRYVFLPNVFIIPLLAIRSNVFRNVKETAIRSGLPQ